MVAGGSRNRERGLGGGVSGRGGVGVGAKRQAGAIVCLRRGGAGEGLGATVVAALQGYSAVKMKPSGAASTLMVAPSGKFEDFVGEGVLEALLNDCLVEGWKQIVRAVPTPQARPRGCPTRGS